MTTWNFGEHCECKICKLYVLGNDDQFDFDDGYSGKAQFIFSVKASSNDTATTPTKDADNGFEADADDQQSANGFRF